MHAFCSPQKVDRDRLGRSPWPEVQACMLCSPSPAIERSFEAASSLTVAGPRRFTPDFPVMPRGHPNKTCVIPRADDCDKSWSPQYWRWKNFVRARDIERVPSPDSDHGRPTDALAHRHIPLFRSLQMSRSSPCLFPCMWSSRS